MLILVVKHLILWTMVLTSILSRRWSLPLLAFALPLTQWFPDIPVPGINALNLLLLPPLIRALSAGPEPGRRTDPILPVAAIFLALVTIAWGRVALADDLPILFLEKDGLYANFVTFKEFVLFVAFYFCGRRLTRDPDDFRLVVYAIFAAYGFEALTAAKEFLVGSAWRATGHLGHPNKLGAFLSAYMMIPIGFLLGGAGKHFIPVASGVVVGILGLLGAVSRAALLALGGAVVILAAIKRSPYIIVFAAAIGTAPMWLPEKMMSRFDSSFEEDEFTGEVGLDTEKEGRVQIWECAMAMIKDQPVLGVGLGLFPYHLREYGYTHRLLKSTHNIYLQLSTEQGLPAAIAHVTIMLVLLITALRVSSRLKGSFEGSFALGYAGCVIAFMIATTFGDSFYENNLSGMFWILGGLIVNLLHGFGITIENQKGESDARGETRASRRFAAAAGGPRGGHRWGRGRQAPRSSTKRNAAW